MPITLNGDTGITTPMYNGAIAANAVTPSVNMKNRIINGAMVIDQRNNGAAVTTTGSFAVDRFVMFKDTPSGTLTAQRSSIAPAGFVNSLSFTVTSAFTPSSSEGNSFCQVIEGFNTADFNFGSANAKTVTLSFWVRSSVTGAYGGSLRNSGGTRSYPFQYTISTANTWEQKSITVPGDTSGTWEITNGGGVFVFFSLGTGANLTAAAGAWVSGDRINSTGSTVLTSTAGATFYITGVQLEVGTNATSFDARPYTTELQLCQRYLQRFGSVSYAGIASGVQGDTTYSSFTLLFTCPMRVAPTMTFSSLIATERAFFDVPITSTSFVHISPNGAFMALNHTAAGAYGRGILLCVQGGTTGFINFNSEI